MLLYSVSTGLRTCIKLAYGISKIGVAARQRNGSSGSCHKPILDFFSAGRSFSIRCNAILVFFFFHLHIEAVTEVIDLVRSSASHANITKKIDQQLLG